jgi:hypothetical protein
MSDIYCSYYTKNNNITSYMVSMIEPTQDDNILEPCGGDGIFIDALLDYAPSLKIDTCDLDGMAVNTMQSKYSSNRNISIREADTLTDTLFDRYSDDGHYDKIIGNPPYGGWQEYDRRAKLKQKYNGFYVKETYALFLLRCISLLKENGILSFIIPDTFLYLHNHKQLRKRLLEYTIIKEIVVFPSRFFPGVSFGYSNMCIITIQKEALGKQKNNNEFSIIKGLKSDADLLSLSKGDSCPCDFRRKFLQRDILNNQDYAFFIGDERTNQSIVSSKYRLADIADCVTGIYCGDNKRFLAIQRGNKRQVSGYPYVGEDEIDYFHKTIMPVETSQKYIPIVKGSSSTSYYRTADKWLIEWTPSALEHYTNDKKARFQNPRYYFRNGIALPMVKSSKIKATLIRSEVFDQSIVGVFPHDEKYLLYILAFLNSEIANEYIHIINPTANNSANYLKKLPIYIPTDRELSEIDELVMAILETHSVGVYQQQIDSFFEKRLMKQIA